MHTEKQYETYENVDPIGNTRSMLTGIVIGSLIGAGTVLLLAPQSGDKTRAEVQQGARELRDKTRETVNETVTQVKTKATQLKSDVKNKADDLQKQGRDILADQLDKVSDAAIAGKKALKEEPNTNFAINN